MEQLGYILLGCILMLVLMLVVVKLRRVNWSKIRLPKLRLLRHGGGKSRPPWSPRTKNSILLSIAAHAVLALLVSLFVVTKEIEHDFIKIEWVKIPRTMRRIKTMEVKPVQPRVIPPKALKTHRVTPTAKPVDVKAAAALSAAHVGNAADVSLDAQEAGALGEVNTNTEQPVVPHETMLTRNAADAGIGRKGKVAGNAQTRGRGKGHGKRRMGSGMVEGTGASDGAKIADTEFAHQESVPDGELGAILEGDGKDISGHIRLIRLKHSLSDWWQDPTAIPSFIKWLKENTRIRADMKYKGGSLQFTNNDILEAPLVFMTGHDTDITTGRGLAKDGPLTDGFTAAERANLRKYIIDHGGMLFFDDCGFNGLFAAQVKAQLEATFPEYPLKDIPHNHEIYKCYFTLTRPPQGGDVFWSTPGAGEGRGATDAGGYRIGTSKFAYQKGIHIGMRLAVVYNRKDYLCSMESAEVDSRASLRDRRSTDVHRFMTNLLVYTMKYGGNTDRTNYRR